MPITPELAIPLDKGTFVLPRLANSSSTDNREADANDHRFHRRNALRLLAVQASAQQAQMTFFVTSVGSARAATSGARPVPINIAKARQSVGAGSKTWRAYLSTQGAGGVNAKDRIGKGPVGQRQGRQIAANVAELHSDNNKINKETALDEKGVDQGTRRHAQPARHANRLAAGRHRCSGAG